MGQYGDKVIVVEPSHAAYGRVGAIAGINSTSYGIRYDDDPEPPATGNWVKKGKVSLMAEVPAFEHPMFLRVIDVVDARVIHGFRLDLAKSGCRHLILTGPNGSGKSSVLQGLVDALRVDHGVRTARLAPDVAIQVEYAAPLHIVRAHAPKEPPLLVYVPPTRRWHVPDVSGPKELPWAEMMDQDLVAEHWMQHLVNQRTALSFAREEGDVNAADELEQWLEQVEQRLTQLMGRGDLLLRFNRSQFRYSFELSGQEVEMSHLPDGFSSLLSIWAEILLREEAHRRIHGDVPAYGYVVIDELESHLHLALQEQVLGLLTAWHPRYQFIVATHAPPILSCIDDALVADLGPDRRIAKSSELRGTPYGNLMVHHFGLSSEVDLETTRLLQEFRDAVDRGDTAAARSAGAAVDERSPLLGLEVWARLRELAS